MGMPANELPTEQESEAIQDEWDTANVVSASMSSVAPPGPSTDALPLSSPLHIAKKEISTFRFVINGPGNTFTFLTRRRTGASKKRIAIRQFK
jgi:hypothetical protein